MERMPQQLPNSDKIPENKLDKAEQLYRTLNPNREKQILAQFTPEQQEEIRQKQQTLSSLAYFIGKDFRIPVELNEPGGGWYWDFKNNEIRIDPKTLLESPIEELRYLMCHEGGHRRVSRTDFIPLEEWQQPGFSAMMNFIEDPRNDNFIAESYPRYRENIDVAWNRFFEEEKQKLEKLAEDRLGMKPRFMQAGYEYIRQWFREIHGEEFEISKDLPEEVKAVVEETLLSAQDSWLRYPSRKEADQSEGLIKKYAELSYQINRDQVWPEFKKLVEEDMEDQKMEEFLKDMQKEKAPGEGEKGLPQELKDQLSPEEQQALEEAIKKAIESASAEASADKQAKKEDIPEDVQGEPSPGSKPVDLESLSADLKQKIKDYIKSLPEELQEEIKDKAQKALKDFEEALNEELQGRLSDNPEKRAEREMEKNDTEDKTEQAQIAAGERITGGKVSQKPTDVAGMRVFSEKIRQEVEKHENEYEKYRMEVLPLIDKLENDLRAIFTERKSTKWEGGFKVGKRIDIGKRIQERAKSVPVMESRSWQRRKMPDEKDYAISLLFDTSGSMFWDKKNIEGLKSIIVLAEVLNRLGINVEILGFNDEMQEYQTFGQDIDKRVREHIGGVLGEIEVKKCDVCKFDHNASDIGWATRIASERLLKQKEENKIMITLSDFVLEESTKHSGDKYRINDVVTKMMKNSGVNSIGLKFGKDGQDINFYPHSISGVDAEKMAEKLADLIKEVIANYQSF